MSFLPSPFQRKRNIELRQDQLSTDDLRKALEAPAPTPEESEADSHDIFKLEPPSANDRYDPGAVLIPAPQTESKSEVQAASAATSKAEPAPNAPDLTIPSRSASALATPASVAAEPAAPKPAMDLSRLSIDNSGHLYWDGKPVEVRRRVSLSPGQILAATIIGLFIIIGGIGAAINGSAAAFDWGCKLGWIRANCASPTLLLPPPKPRVDIPA
jgi:hypothetical protein